MRAGRVTAGSQELKAWDRRNLVPNNNKSRIIPVSPTQRRGVANVNVSGKNKEQAEKKICIFMKKNFICRKELTSKFYLHFYLILFFFNLS